MFWARTEVVGGGVFYQGRWYDSHVLRGQQIDKAVARMQELLSDLEQCVSSAEKQRMSSEGMGGSQQKGLACSTRRGQSTQRFGLIVPALGPTTAALPQQANLASLFFPFRIHMQSRFL